MLAASSDSPELVSDTMERLRAIGRAYERNALGFTCREEVRAVRYSPSTARSWTQVNDYFLIRDDEPGSFVAVRERLSGNRLPAWGRRAHAPEPYLWPLLLASSPEASMQLGDQAFQSTSGPLERELAWQNSAPVSTGATLQEWSGKFLIDSTTLLPLRLTAHPSFQAQRVQVQRMQRAQSWRICVLNAACFRTKPPARERELVVTWHEDHDGLLYPLESIETVYRRYGPSQFDRRIEREVRRRYFDYRFFAAEAMEQELDVDARGGRAPRSL